MRWLSVACVAMGIGLAGSAALAQTDRQVPRATSTADGPRRTSRGRPIRGNGPTSHDAADVLHHTVLGQDSGGNVAGD